MSIKIYLKQRWYVFSIAFVAGGFAYLILWSSESTSKASINYLLQGLALFFIVGLVCDFILINQNMHKLKSYLNENATKELVFHSPYEQEIANEAKHVLLMHNAYRMEIEQQHVEELEFITQWVHDVKVPLAAIKLLLEKYSDDSNNKLEMQTHYIEQQVEKILYHMKVKSFHDDYKIKEQNIKPIVMAALKPYAIFVVEKKLTLNLRCESVTISTDAKWSEYILSQLISNAVKNMPTHATLTITTEIRNQKVSVIVKNTNSYIPLNQSTNIFKRGFSKQPSRLGSKSTGYGLYLANKLAKRMGHQLTAESDGKTYASFKITYEKAVDNVHVTKL